MSSHIKKYYRRISNNLLDSFLFDELFGQPKSKEFLPAIFASFPERKMLAEKKQIDEKTPHF